MEKLNKIIIFISIIFVTSFIITFLVKSYNLISNYKILALSNDLVTNQPLIELKGEKEITIYLNEKYIEYGYNVLKEDVTVKITNEVLNDKQGIYYVKYEAKDKFNNKEILKREVKVISKDNLDNKKYIYLTFDDGPSYSITEKLLDILKEENVKATFFIINHSNELNYLIKREYKEGHKVGMHSYSHSYKTIYSSIENYFNDLNLIRNKIYSITGYYSNLVRFPGGTSNTISQNYSKGIMTKLTKELENKNLYYFDWNISSGDASGKIGKNRIIKNVTNNLRYTHNVILMHDFENNYATLNAIKEIIKYGKENGYIFATLSENGPYIHHKVQN